MPSSRHLTVYRRLAAYARPYWPQILLVLLLQLLATPLALLGPVPLKIAVDTVIGSRPLPGWLQAVLPASLTGSATMLLGLAAALLVLTAVLGSLLDMATGLLQTYTGEKLAQDFRSRLFRHVQRLSLSYHDMTGTSDSTYRIQYDAPAIQRIVVDGLIPLFGSAVTLVAMICRHGAHRSAARRRRPVGEPHPVPAVAVVRAAAAQELEGDQAARQLGHGRRAGGALRRPRGQGLRARGPRARTVPPPVQPARPTRTRGVGGPGELRPARRARDGGRERRGAAHRRAAGARRHSSAWAACCS